MMRIDDRGNFDFAFALASYVRCPNAPVWLHKGSMLLKNSHSGSPRPLLNREFFINMGPFRPEKIFLACCYIV
jgi:hypothetical protein